MENNKEKNTPERDDKLVSIVVPIYKVEDLLPRCLDSIAAQDHRPLQVILVNDGSPDNCRAIIAEYVAKYPDIFESIEQENKGLGPARNAGIARARGRWLCMVDSDDYIEPDYVSTLLKLAEEKGAEVSVSSFYMENSKGRKISFPFMFPRMISGRKAAKEALNMLTVPNFVWNKLYETRLFHENEIKFPKLYYEDLAVTVKILMQADKVAMCAKPLYHYVSREGSIVGSFNEKNVRDYLEVMEILTAFMIEQKLYDEWKSSWYWLIANSKRNLAFQIFVKLKHLSLGERKRYVRQVNALLNDFDRKVKASGRRPGASADPGRS